MTAAETTITRTPTRLQMMVRRIFFFRRIAGSRLTSIAIRQTLLQNPVQVRDSWRNMLEHKALCLFSRSGLEAPTTRFREEQIPFEGHGVGCCCIGRGYWSNGLGIFT